MNTTKRVRVCEHNMIGKKAIGGFPSHPHTHPVGSPYCFDCNKTVKEIIAEAIALAKEEQGAEERLRAVEILYKAFLKTSNFEVMNTIEKVQKDILSSEVSSRIRSLNKVKE